MIFWQTSGRLIYNYKKNKLTKTEHFFHARAAGKFWNEGLIWISYAKSENCFSETSSLTKFHENCSFGEQM